MPTLAFTDPRRNLGAWANRLSISQEAVEIYAASDVIDLHLDTFIWTRIFGYDLAKKHGGMSAGEFAVIAERESQRGFVNHDPERVRNIAHVEGAPERAQREEAPAPVAPVRTLRFGERWRVRLDDALFDGLRDWLPADAVGVMYG